MVNLVRVADGEEALQLGNQYEHGLTASVWTKIFSQALEYSDCLQAGDGVGKQPYLNLMLNVVWWMKQSGTGLRFG